MSARTFTLDGQLVTAAAGQTILEAAREHDVVIPTLCQLDGLSTVGACRLCLVEVAGSNKLLPACTTAVQEGMSIVTRNKRLEHYRQSILELFLAERNHICAVCVSNGHCELQDRAQEAGVTHVRFDYLSPSLPLDMSHDRFAVDHNRCILCTRCVRVCDEVEGAHTWDVMARGVKSLVITDMAQPWGDSQTCTSCGKCVQVCPTGALFDKHASAGGMIKHPGFVPVLQHARRRNHDAT
jgi:bidirectional [NiFe] hydrogenase diaphorase subunit